MVAIFTISSRMTVGQKGFDRVGWISVAENALDGTRKYPLRLTLDGAFESSPGPLLTGGTMDKYFEYLDEVFDEHPNFFDGMCALCKEFCLSTDEAIDIMTEYDRRD